MDDPAITCRAYEAGDEIRIVELANAAFGLRRTAAWWRWQYLGNPIDRRDIVVACQGGAVVGHIAGVPLALRHRGADTQATRIQNVCVRAELRRSGLFTALLGRFHDDLRARGVEIAIGFPNESSLPAFLKTSLYTHPFDVPRLRLPLGRVAGAPPPAGLVIADAPLFDAADVALVRRHLEGVAIHTLRDEATLRWRYGPGSGHAYRVARVRDGGELVGLAVVKPYPAGRALDLVELFFPDDEALLRGALAAIAASFRGEAADALCVWSTPHHPLHRCLRRAGFEPEERGGTHFIVHGLSPACAGPWGDPSWYSLSMGDSDVY